MFWLINFIKKCSQVFLMIRQVWDRKDGRKLVTIPKDSDIEAGEYVQVKLVEEDD